MSARRVTGILLILFGFLPGAAAHAQTTPALTMAVTGGGPLSEPGSVATATVRLSGSTAATGTIAVRVFGPADRPCTAEPLQSWELPVNGDGEQRVEFRPDDVGTFRFDASYGGDAANAPASSGCGVHGQDVTMTQARPSLATTASPSVAVGGELFETARLARSHRPTGVIVFRLHGPGDETCTGAPLAHSTVAVDPDSARATSAPHVATASGIYRWIAYYAGDARNQPAAQACGDGAAVAVTAVPSSESPRLGIRTGPATASGGRIAATAILATAGIPSGFLTFRVFGPDDDQCQRGVVAASTRAVLGSGEYASDPFVPTRPGTYRFVVEYHGTPAAMATPCSDPAATAVVTPAPEPVPVLERTFTVERVKGSVFVQAPARTARRSARTSAIGFVEVRAARSFPVGSVVDTSAGTAKVTTATADASLQSGTFRGGRFVVRQQATGRGLVDIALRVPAAAARSCTQATARSSKRRRVSRRVLAKLNAQVRGRFRTSGKHSSAAAQGTEWLTVERCDGTLTRVTTHTVKVRDFGLRRTFVLRAGRSHLARRTH